MDHRTVELSSGQRVCEVEIEATRRPVHRDVELRRLQFDEFDDRMGMAT